MSQNVKRIIILIVSLMIIGISFIIITIVFNNFSFKKHSEVTQAPVFKPASKDMLLQLVNKERTKVGVQPLVIDPKLSQSAQWKADKMTATKNYSHLDPISGRNDGLDYLDSLRPQCSNISENLEWLAQPGTRYGTSNNVVNVWVHSKAHYTAMVNPEYVSTGFGISGSNIVEHFCKK